ARARPGGRLGGETRGVGRGRAGGKKRGGGAGKGEEDRGVPADQEHEQAGTGGGPCLRWIDARVRPHRSTPTCRRMSLSITRSSSAARSAWRAAAACG